ncbi:MAG: methyltransferase domain-containing protein [Promethearchaeota archaeon]
MVTVGKKNKATRERWLKQTLEKIPKGSRILDAGAGEQQYKKFCNHLNYVSQDFSQYDGKGDGRGLQKGEWDQSKIDIVSNITTIPEPDASFDAIMCIEVFEHLPAPIKALEELTRLLKPNGHLIITAPFCSITHYAPYHFYSGFNRYFYETFLKENGYEIIDLEENGNFFEFIAQEIRRIPSIVNLFVKKSRATRRKSFFIKKLSKYILMPLLEFFSKNDHGSSELLSFGYHVYAVKKGL